MGKFFRRIGNWFIGEAVKIDEVDQRIVSVARQAKLIVICLVIGFIIGVALCEGI